LAARQSFRKINYLLLDCALHGLGVHNFKDEHTSGEKNFLEKLLPRYIDDRHVNMIDVGANVGDYSSELKRLYPQASIWAFEPNPKTYASLQQTLGGTDVTIENKGLGREASELSFYDRADLDGTSGHGSLYRGVIENIHKQESVELTVQIESLDRYSEANGIERIKLLKIDTEGHELEVIKGARSLIKDNCIDLIQIEFNEMNIVSRVFFRDFVNELTDYIPYRLLPNGVIQLKKSSPRRTELFTFQNIIFVHKHFKPTKSMKPTSK